MIASLGSNLVSSSTDSSDEVTVNGLKNQASAPVLSANGISTYDTLTLSTAAQAVAATRSSTTSTLYSGLSSSDLQVIHARVDNELSKGFWASDPTTRATQLPEPATPDRLASAKSATAYVAGDLSANPFKTLSRDALTSVIYDESGKYTLNEREAALSQQENNDSAFVTEASALSESTGDKRYLASALLQFHNNLSPVEAAVSNKLQYLTTPASQLIEQLDEADNEHGGPLKVDVSYPNGWTANA